MGYYLNTEDIEVFPSTRRATHQVSARLISEKSIASIVNKLIDTNGFVITPNNDTTGLIPLNTPFEFNIHGYYFIASSAQDIIDLVFNSYNTDDKVYANIYLETIDGYTELKGQDEDDGHGSNWTYHGITFSDVDLADQGSPAADYSLLLFVYDGTNWQVPEESRVKFEYSFALGVDGGEI